MKKIALTGGIATGKSYVLARLKERGVPVIDADDVVHEMLGSGTAVAELIEREFGEAFLKEDGSVDRAMIASKVFGDPLARRRLEAIIHPAVYVTIQQWFDRLDGAMGIASIPLLYETGRDKDFEAVVVTVCSSEAQLERLVARPGMTLEEAQQRIAAQIPADEKAARGDFVIQTGGSKAETDRQVDELLAALRRD
jgi:dephospho-CoA kinase